MDNSVKNLLEDSTLALDYLEQYASNSVFPMKITKCQDIKELALDELFLFHITEVTYQDKAPRREAVENILGAFRGLQGINFVYMLLGTVDHVDFYFGVAKDKSFTGKRTGELADIAKAILQPGLSANFRGCQIRQIQNVQEKQSILERLKKSLTPRKELRYGILEGVPTLEKQQQQTGDEQLLQGVDRLIDVMNGKNFGLVVIAQPCSLEDTRRIAADLSETYDMLAPLAKHSLQHVHTTSRQEGKTEGFSIARQAGKNNQDSDSYSETKNDSRTDDGRTDENSQITAAESNSGNHQVTRSKSFNESHTNGNSGSSRDDHTISRVASGDDSDSSNWSKNNTYSNTLAISTTNAHSVSESETHSKNSSKSFSNTLQRNKSTNKNTADIENDSYDEHLEVTGKKAQQWLDYLDKILYPRHAKCMGKGMFITSIYLFAENPISLLSLANTSQSIFSGNEPNAATLKFEPLDHRKECEKISKALQNLQIPLLETEKSGKQLDIALSRAYIGKLEQLGSWLSTSELAVVAGLPQREVAGLGLRKEVEFGLNIPVLEDEEKDSIKLGCLVEGGEVKENMPVHLSKSNLDMHTFITGVTGSGKTVTSQKILLESGLPFLVVEPAKTEYRILKKLKDDIVIFTPGRQDVAPFFLNPFELFPGEAITSRADMLKATMEASFDMEAAIPQILESAIYLAYKKKGWNIRNNKWNGMNEKDANGPFADGVYAFPTLSDFIEAVEEVTNEQGFSQRLKDDYLGSLRARLLGLTVGSKGMMLNTARSVNFKELINKRVVIELEEIKNVSEKSMIMGFILTNLMEAVKYAHRQASKEGKRFQHITLIEEAHRLLSRYTPGDSINKKQGVETFADMLAEVRKYGESLIIVDQIPEKMTPEVLKNTNTKIVHKLFAQDDKDAIGNAIVLEDEQKAFLSNLQQGRAIVFSQGWTKAAQVKVDKTISTEGYKEIEPEELHAWSECYYVDNCKNGCLKGLEHKQGKITLKDVQDYLELMLDDESLEVFKCIKLNKSFKYKGKNIASGSEEMLKLLSGMIKELVKTISPEVYELYIYWNLFDGEDVNSTIYSKLIKMLQLEKVDYEAIGKLLQRRA